MSRFRLFIFSSDSLSRLGRPPKGVIAAAVLTLALIVSAELFVRMLITPLGRLPDYWDKEAALKFEYYRIAMGEGHVPELLVIGDSTAAFNLDSQILAHDSQLEGIGLNLAWPANFPLAMPCTTLPLFTDASTPKVVVLSLSPKSFVELPSVRQLEEGILSSPICREARGESMVSRHIALLRLRRALPYLANRSFFRAAVHEPPALMGFTPLDPKTPRFVDRPSASDTPAELTAERLAVITDLARLSRIRRFALVVVVPPIIDDSPFFRTVRGKYLGALKDAKSQFGFTIIDSNEMENSNRLTFWDPYHLDSRSAREFSKELAHELFMRHIGQGASGNDKRR